MNTAEDPSISKDGRPLPPPGKLQVGLGLRAMRRRTELPAATLTQHRGPAGGAVLALTLTAFAAPMPPVLAA